MNNSSTTDFYNECVRDDFPYKVHRNYYIPVFSSSYSSYYSPYSSPYSKKEEEPIESRFDILDIMPENKSYNNLTVEKIQKRLNKIKDEIINGKDIWTYEEEKLKVIFSEDNFIKFLEEDLKEHIKNSMIKYIENQQINSRFEVLDL